MVSSKIPRNSWVQGTSFLCRERNADFLENSVEGTTLSKISKQNIIEAELGETFSWIQHSTSDKDLKMWVLFLHQTEPDCKEKLGLPLHSKNQSISRVNRLHFKSIG